MIALLWFLVIALALLGFVGLTVGMMASQASRRAPQPPRTPLPVGDEGYPDVFED